MKMQMDEQTVRSLWREFFETYNYVPRMAEIAHNYPEKRSLFVEEKELHEFNPEFLEEILNAPLEVLEIGKEVMLEMMPTPEEEIDTKKLWIRLVPTHRPPIPIRDIRETSLYRFITVEGLLRRVTEVRPRIIIAAFKCKNCGAVIRVRQETGDLIKPVSCEQKQGGCGKLAQQTDFVLRPEDSEFIDQQKIEIQESPETMPRGGVQPQRLMGYIEDDLCGQIFPGDRVQLSGILLAIQKIKGKTTEFEITLNVNNLRKLSKEYTELELTKEEIEEIENAANDPDIFNKVVHSIAPTIAGMEDAKRAIALQLVGGVPKTLEDGVRRKGDIHILLVGDPGTAKSQLLTFVARIVPRGIYAVGKSTSASGLTAAAVKDEFGEGRWTLEAGALVLADTGIACIDELDKMSKEDRSAMHEALEQQTVTVSKAGIYATLNTRCPVLAAANPKEGRFNPNKLFFNQIDLPETLISRFDIVIPVLDKPDAERDESIATHILKAHLHGEVLALAGEGRKPDIEDTGKDLQPAFQMDFLKKYISHARKCIPVLSDKAREIIQKKYVEIRTMYVNEEEEVVPITPRQLEAMVRLSEAAAKLRLSKVVTEEDALLAVEIFMKCYRMVAYDQATNKLDVDIIHTGMPKSKRDAIATIRDILTELESQNKDTGAAREDVINLALERGIDETSVNEIIEKMKKNGEIYEPKEGHYRRIRD
ncbi:MAG: minichromosome maintenance protein MCM [Thermoplasmata archaeon]|nr:minichromosome maintenance protein MCM [Thermoplasmata archaeon]